jgi:hypothetical protein
MLGDVNPDAERIEVTCMWESNAMVTGEPARTSEFFLSSLVRVMFAVQCVYRGASSGQGLPNLVYS